MHLSPATFRSCARSLTLLSLVLGAASLCSAGTITYNYTGNDFTYAVAPYTTSDSVTGSFTMASPLPPGLVGQPNQSVNPSSYNFSDGILSYTSTNGSDLFFDISTDTRGAISGWLIQVCEGAVACGHPGSNSLLTEDVVPTVFDGVQVQGEGYETRSDSNPGTWTATLNGFQGGTSSAPTVIVGASIGEITGTIGGNGSQDYYSFFWGGGQFSATATITGANPGASYAFSFNPSFSGCANGPITLNSSDNFSYTYVSSPLLSAGQYCIGIDANSANDPAFALTFNTPVEGVTTPEPSTFLPLSVGLGMVSVLRLARRSRKNS